MATTQQYSTIWYTYIIGLFYHHLHLRNHHSNREDDCHEKIGNIADESKIALLMH